MYFYNKENLYSNFNHDNLTNSTVFKADLKNKIKKYLKPHTWPKRNYKVLDPAEPN